MNIILLSKGIFATIDEEDFNKLSKHKWYFNRGYAVRHPRMVNGIRRGKIQMHRVVIGAKRGEIVDHINGNGLDNRKSNLRIVTNTQNSWNSKVLGITFHIRDKKWQVRAQNNGKRVQVGYFNTIEEARTARNKFIKETRGEYARL